MITNGLELKEIDSFSEPFKGIPVGELKTKLNSHFSETGFVVAYLDNRVLLGRWENGDYYFHDNQIVEEKFIQKIRVFNKTKEFYSWRTKSGFDGRLRKDDDRGRDIDVVVAKQLLVGTEVKNNSKGFTEICEMRGSNIMVPFENIVVDEKDNRLFIKTHNYIEYTLTGQATYTDCRFVAFTDSQRELR